MILVALAYFLSGRLGLLLPYKSSVTFVWLPAGIAMAACYGWGSRMFIPIATATLAMQFRLGHQWPVACLIAFGSGLGPVLGARVLHGLALDPKFRRIRDVMLFCGIAPLATAAAATFGVLGLWLAGRLAGPDLATGWVAWWLGDAVAVLLLTPALIALNRDTLSEVKQFLWESIALAAAIVSIVAGVFLSSPDRSPLLSLLSFLPWPLMVGAALRLPLAASGAIALLVSLTAVAGTSMDRGPFGPLSRDQASLGVGLYIGTLAATMLVVAALRAARSQAETAVSESNDRLARAQRVARIGSWELNPLRPDRPGESPATWSDELFRIFGYEPGSVPVNAQTFYDRVHPEDREATATALAKALQTGCRYDLEHRLLLPDGSVRWIHEQADFVLDPVTGRPVRALGTAQDITEHKLARLEQQRLEERLRQAGKMESLGTLSGGVAHEFNNLFTAVLGNADLARHAIEPSHPAIHQLDEIVHASQRARTLVDRILAFSRQQGLNRVRKPLDTLLQDKAAKYARELPANITFVLASAAALPAVPIDEPLFRRSLNELVDNARKAIGSKPGRIRLSAEATRLSPRNSTGLPGGDYLRISVSDDGPGIDPDIAGRVFEPFFTTRAPGAGSGLGLAVVHGVMTGHQGTVLHQSVPGGGTRFDLYFPVNPGTEPVPFTGSPEAPLPAQAGFHAPPPAGSRSEPPLPATATPRR
jgi:PAS domain S-box-containing protein